MTRILFALSLLICLNLPCEAQDDASGVESVIEPYDSQSEDGNDHALVSPKDLTTSRAYRSGELSVSEFDKDKWKAIVNGVNYDEGTEPNKEEKEIAPWGGMALKVISYLIIAAVLVAVIYYLTRFLSFGASIERTTMATNDVDAPVEDIAELDIATLLDQAKRVGNYKLAIRLYYLGLLKKLNDKGAIVWKKDKTNRDYLAELFPANVFFNDVRKLTLSYEAVWYGDHDLSPETFQVLTMQFELLYNQIHPSDKV